MVPIDAPSFIEIGQRLLASHVYRQTDTQTDRQIDRQQHKNNGILQ